MHRIRLCVCCVYVLGSLNSGSSSLLSNLLTKSLGTVRVQLKNNGIVASSVTIEQNTVNNNNNNNNSKNNVNQINSTMTIHIWTVVMGIYLALLQ